MTETSIPLQHLDILHKGEKGITIGQGSDGTVKVYALSGQKYAVKLGKLLDDEISPSFIRESSMMMRLSHPNVISLIDAGFFEKETFLVMPLAHSSLADQIKHNALVPEQKKSYSFQLLLGVRYLHSRNVIHRDLKPDNLLIMTDGTLTIADFGSAKALSCVSGIGMTQEVVTLYYRAPEILLGGNYNENADRWSVGCILYEMYTGERLFRSRSEIDLLFRIFRYLGSPTAEEWPGVTEMPAWIDDYSKFSKPTRETLTKKQINALSIKTLKQHLRDRNLWTTGTLSELRERLYTDVSRTPKLMVAMIHSLLILNPMMRASLTSLIENSYYTADVAYVQPPMKMYSCIENLHLRTSQISLSPRDDEDDTYTTLIHWMYGVYEYCKYVPRTWFLSVYILHLASPFISALPLKDLQCAGAACMYISALYNERELPLVYDMVHMTDNTYTDSQIVEMSKDILKHINYDLLWVMPSDYLSEYEVFYGEDVKRDARKFLTMLSMTKLFASIPIDQQALVAIMTACVLLKVPFKHGLTSKPELLEHYNLFLSILDIRPEFVRDIWSTKTQLYDQMLDKLRTGRIILHL